MAIPDQFDLFSTLPSLTTERTDLSWPEDRRFPHNEGQHAVEQWIIDDLRRSSQPLIVTAYTSLDHLLANLNRLPCTQSLRLLLGNEPMPARSTNYRVDIRDFPQEVVDCWLERYLPDFRQG